MSRIFNFYAKNKDGVDTDFTWYDSSNIKYSECTDPDNELKTLTVVFNNGSKYAYKDVDSTKYLLFREDASQGKALNKFIKGSYEYEKLENADVDMLNAELDFRTHDGMFVNYDVNDNKLIIKNNVDSTLIEKEVKLSKDAFDTICEVLRALGKNIRVDVKGDFEED